MRLNSWAHPVWPQLKHSPLFAGLSGHSRARCSVLWQLAGINLLHIWYEASNLHAASTVVDPYDSTSIHVSTSSVEATSSLGSSIIPSGAAGIVAIVPATIGCSVVFPASGVWPGTSMSADAVLQVGRVGSAGEEMGYDLTYFRHCSNSLRQD